MSPALVVFVLALGLLVGALVGWGLAPRGARPLPEPAPTPELPPAPPPGLEYAAPGFRTRYAPRARDLAVEVAAIALVESGVEHAPALELAAEGRAAELGERAGLDLLQAAWVEGARDLAAAVREASPLPEGVTARLLDLGYRAALSTPPAPRA